MIKNINFAGKLEISKQLKKPCPERDISKLQKYADDIKGDVFIQEIKEYKTGEKIYKGYASINNRLYDIIYDTKHPQKTKKSSTQMPPAYW